MDEKQLVLSAKNGDKEAFCALYSLYKTRLYRYAFYRLGNPEDAEDAVSDCVIAAFEHIKTLKKAEAFPAWIFAILYRSCNAVISQCDIQSIQSVYDRHRHARGDAGRWYD